MKELLKVNTRKLSLQPDGSQCTIRWHYAQLKLSTRKTKYTHFDEHGTAQNFDIVPFNTQTDILTNGHTAMSQNFDIVPW